MLVELKVPPAGESITEVTVVEWLKEEGSAVSADETVAVIETDKANVELPAPVSGRLTRILKAAGDSAEVGEVIGYVEKGDHDGRAKPATEETPPSTSRGREARARAAPEARPEPPTPRDPRAKPLAAPSVRRAMREQKREPGEVDGSGPAGRILMKDLRQEIEAPEGSRREERQKMSGLRRRIAERLVLAQQHAALLTTFNEVDMRAVMALRKEYQERFVARYGIKLGFMSFFVKAAVEGLKELPAVNGWIEGDDIVYHDYCDIGVAVGGGRGLVVPVLRNAERLGFAQIEKAIADFATRARENKLKVEELQGGTFTISNGGVYGSLLSTPIVNPPESAILGMHAIQERPVVRDGQIAVAPMMYVALTYDHRIIDGREAVTFLVRIKELIENPARLLLEV